VREEDALASATDEPHAALAEPRVVPVHTAVRGRARFAVAGLYHGQALAQVLERQLRRRRGIVSASASPLTGKLLVLFDPEVGAEQVRTWVEEAVAARQRGRGSGGKDDSIAAGAVDRMPDDDGPAWHRLTGQRAAALLETCPRSGLRQEMAAHRLERGGPNRLPGAAARSGIEIFAEQFNSLPVALLGAAAVLSLLTGGVVEAIAIAGVIGLNAGIGYLTESEAERTINALTGQVLPPVTVLRSGRRRQVPVEEVVPGDVIELTPGAIVAADARLIEADRLTIDESALTGESLPVVKRVASLRRKRLPLAERLNLAFMGTTVAGGSGRALVVATGGSTQLGLISAMVGEARAPATPLQRQLEVLGRKLVAVSAGICGLVFALGLLRGYGVVPMLKSSISLAIAAVPEGLPAVATTTLALGIGAMRRHNVLIRQLRAVETLGALQVVCLDKTGTITLNRMKAISVATPNGTNGHAQAPEELPMLLKVGVLCSEAKLRRANGAYVVKGSPTEAALVQLAIDHGVDVAGLRRSYPLVRVEHRAERQQFMVTAHATEGGDGLVAVKGSPEEVLALCDRRTEGGVCRPLTEADRRAIAVENDRMGATGLRVLGMASSERPGKEIDARNGLCWLGLVGLADPIRPKMPELIAAFHDAGIRTVMVTGDQPATARAIAKELGLNGSAALEVIDAEALSRMEPEQLAAIARKGPVFARVSPSHKLAIVQAMQSAGLVTAMTGDGINDGPALKAADIGIAMGRGGTDLARQTASVVIEDDDLSTMLEAVRRGRTIHANIRRSIRFILATNLSEIMVMLAATALGIGSPLNPLQLLWINLISDVFPCLALAVEPPEPDVLRQPPRDPAEPIVSRADLPVLTREAAVIGGSALGAYGFGLWRYGSGTRASTLAFSTLISAQLLHAWSCRSERHGLLTGRPRPPNRYLDAAVAGSLALQLVATFVPGLRRLLGVERLGMLDGLVVGAGAMTPFLVNEALKASQGSGRSPKPLRPDGAAASHGADPISARSGPVAGSADPAWPAEASDHGADQREGRSL
jgi:P-type Ca2+ transporter type 2C